jgi:hypothetical protein
MAINHNAQFESQPWGMPPVIFAFHCEMLSVLRETSMPAHSGQGNEFACSRADVQRESSGLASQWNAGRIENGSRRILGDFRRRKSQVR